ncbi:MAG: undecaprenyldiphospho-muramoylpentapeptide beta-N-acetylglucosaminyltransferase [Gammaproteobacteria bacterium]|nr:undecaprenyldiphospho-muramoylpentapeptide beta-N-acetylglucosaminyltransferase [Gammaproteobacteria bacterium]
MSQRVKHILITAGGTGGHVFPALSVAKSLIAKGHKVTWLGTKRGIESRVVPESGIEIEYISVEGLRGQSKASLVLAPFKLTRAIIEAVIVIRRLNPDCVVGFGGFVAGPGGIVARMLAKPLVIHEQNSVAGLTNRWLAKFATRVLTGFPSVVDFGHKSVWVGNPVRESIIPKEQGKRGRIRILVVGGSQGAHSFNMKLPKVFSELGVDLKIKHQSGLGKAKQVRALYELNQLNAKVVEFIDDMAAAYQWADLLVCRAGAMTIAECCAARKPALLIPYPFSAGDHQIHNANTLVDAGAAEMVLNHKIDSTEMFSALQRLVADRARLQKMGANAGALHKPNATGLVVSAISEVLNA